MVYSLKNNYLMDRQKILIEFTYQFPDGVLQYALAFIALALHQRLWVAFLGATLVCIPAWLFARFHQGRVLGNIGMFFGGRVGTFIDLILAGLALYLGRWEVAIYLGLASIGFTRPVELPGYLWVWTSVGMHPKYQMAKRMFHTRFPFEKDFAASK